MMCSIFKYKTCVGRNFDYEISYDEELRRIKPMEFGNDLAVMGMCAGMVDYPLMYDGINECGLVVGALAFNDNAVYFDENPDKLNIPAFDFVFRLLSSFKSVKDVKYCLGKVNISNKQFSDEFPNSDLHWFVADKSSSMIIEQTKDGLMWYDGDVMTNNPPYEDQVFVSNLLNEKIGEPHGMNVIKKLERFNTRGEETFGLRGDYTSLGRFNRLSYFKKKLENHKNNFNLVSQSFHLCSSVEQIFGVTPVADKFEYTIYSMVYDIANCRAYLKTYDSLEVEEYEL